MTTTENLGLSIITDSTEDRQMLFSEWRARIAGADSTSNMNLIDAAIGEIREQLDDIGGDSGVEAAHFPDTGKFMAGSGSATANYAVAVGQETSASGVGAFAEGNDTAASGDYSHAEGQSSEAIGASSHAEGSSTSATQTGAHAEGYSTTASGASSHAEGDQTTASGDGSHSEGSSTQAVGDYSHASGEGTIASHKSQMVFGRYNEADPSQQGKSGYGNYVEIVGNGENSVDGRSNARTLDWSGNEVLAGDLTINAGSANETNIREALAELSDGVDTNKAAFQKVFRDAVITPNESGYIVLTGIMVEKDSPVSDSAYVHTVVECSEGDAFLVNAAGTTATGTWAFIDAEGNVVLSDDLSGYDGVVTRHNVDATAPENSAYLIINHLADEVKPSYKSFDISGYIDNIDTDVGEHFTEDNGFVVGTGTESLSDSQVVFGKYNITDDQDTYAEIVGNGTGDEARSNARTLDWSGNEVLAGGLTAGGNLVTSGSLTLGGNVTVTANDMTRMKRLSIEDGGSGLIIRL